MDVTDSSALVKGPADGAFAATLNAARYSTMFHPIELLAPQPAEDRVFCRACSLAKMATWLAYSSTAWREWRT
jgi:hypothetical protein